MSCQKTDRTNFLETEKNESLTKRKNLSNIYESPYLSINCPFLEKKNFIKEDKSKWVVPKNFINHVGKKYHTEEMFLSQVLPTIITNDIKNRYGNLQKSKKMFSK